MPMEKRNQGGGGCSAEPLLIEVYTRGLPLLSGGANIIVVPGAAAEEHWRSMLIRWLPEMGWEI